MKTFVDILNDDSLELKERMHAAVTEALSELELAKAVLDNDDTYELKGYALNGVQQVVERVYNILSSAADFYYKTE